MENEKRIDSLYKKEKEKDESIEGLEKKRQRIMNEWDKNNYLLNKVRSEKGCGYGNGINKEMNRLEKESIFLNSKIQELKLRRDVKEAIREEKERESLSNQWRLNESYIKLLQTKADILKNKHILGDDGEDYKKWKEYTDKVKLVKEKQEGIEDRLEQMAEKMILNK